jgi:ABC-type nitrate/sulfonate/bicarbonate transport system substrate-binding protein
VGRVSDVQNHREQIKAVLRAVLRSNEMILKNDAEVIPFIQKEFGLEQNVAADSYRQIKQLLNADGDIEEPVLKSILNKIRQESGVTAEIPVDRLVDLSLLREARSELRKR